MKTISWCMAALFCVPVFTGNASRKPTFTKEVARILQKNCPVCHRPGEAGPFCMLAYDQTRLGQQRFGKLSTRKMPSWFADPRYGKFSNATALTQDEIDTLAGWVEAGAPEGDPDDMPAPMQFFEEWQIGKPDLVFELPKPFEVSASGMIDYQHVIVPRGGHTLRFLLHWFKQKFAYEMVDDVLRRLSGLSEQMGAMLDVGQMAACGQDPVDAVGRLALHLKIVHLKDVAGAGAEHNVLFGHGVVNIRAVMKALRATDFKGWLPLTIRRTEIPTRM